MIDSEGYVFCQKLKAEGLKRILAASDCIGKIGENVLSWTKELKTKGLLRLNKIQHWDANGRTKPLDFFIKRSAIGIIAASYIVDRSILSSTALLIEGVSEGMNILSKKNKDLIPAAKLEERIKMTLKITEYAVLAISNPHLAVMVFMAHLATPALEKLDKFALEHGQDWRTKTGGLYTNARG